MNIVFDPFLPDWALWLAVIIGIGVAAISLWRNWKSGVFRALALAGLLALLVNPLLREGERTALDDIAVILVDESASQGLDERYAVASNAAEKLETSLEALGGIETRRLAYDGEEETLTLEALSTALADTPRARLGAVFIVTDGQTRDEDKLETFSTLDVPTHLLLTGRASEVDRKITLTNAPRYGIVGQPVRVSFRIDDLGPDNEQINDRPAADVILRVDGEEILRQPVEFGDEVGFDAPLDRPGRKIIELEVEARDGELTTRNNIAVLPISAIRDRLRVLLISGEPHPGERVWRNLLKSDPAVDLVHFTILRPIEKNDGTPVSELALIQFPQDELFIEKLTEFDLVIFDRYTYRSVLDAFHFDNIARYVEQGGAVLVAAGPEYNGARSLASRRNLAFILPAMPAGPEINRAFRPSITEQGQRHPVTEGLPEEGFWGRWLRIMPVAQRKGRSLMAGPNEAPLLILDRVGDGRIGLLLSDHVWLWARGFDGGGPHAELLRRIAHWLMKEPELEEESLVLNGSASSLTITRRTMEEAISPVSLTRPNGETVTQALTQTSPGIFEARLENASRGLYRARSDELFAIGAVGLAAATEFEDVVSTTQQLAPLAEQTGGGIFQLRSGASSEPQLPTLRRISTNTSARSAVEWAGIIERKAARIDRVNDKPIAPPLAWLVLIGAALLLSWLIEGGRLSELRRRQISKS